MGFAHIGRVQAAASWIGNIKGTTQAGSNEPRGMVEGVVLPMVGIWDLK
jgi:hypothetical protein